MVTFIENVSEQRTNSGTLSLKYVNFCHKVSANLDKVT